MQASPGRPEPLGLLVAAVRRGARQLLTARLAALGLQVQEFWILVGIAEHGPCAQAELAAILRLDVAAISRVTRALQARGLVRARRDAADRRRVLIGLGPAGEKLARTLRPVAADIRGTIDSALDPAELAATCAALRKVAGALADRLAAETAGTPPLPIPARRRGARPSVA